MLVQGHSACRIDEGEFLIDTLTITLDLSVLGHWIDRVADFDNFADTLNQEDFSDPAHKFVMLRKLTNLVSKLFPKDSIQVSTDIVRGRNFFNHRIDFKDRCGFIAFGGNNTYVDKEGNDAVVKERLQVHLTGEGCRRVHDFDYLHERISLISDYAPKITRIDIAYDDHQGARNIELCENMYSHGYFNGNGRPPKARKISDFGSGDGCSMYVGSVKSGKELCCYEKGKEQGDKTSPWTRWEGKLYSQDRLIPLDVLTDYEAFLVGMYEKAFQWMGKASRVVKTQKTKERIQYTHLREHAKISYGPLIHYMKKKGLNSEEIISELINSKKFPSRLEWTSFEHENISDVSKDKLISYEESHPHLFHSVNLNIGVLP